MSIARYFNILNIALIMFVGIFLWTVVSNKVSWTVLTAAITIMLSALTYQLGYLNYHRGLFAERLEVFQATEKILILLRDEPPAEKMASWRRDIINQLWMIESKVYFLFGHETNEFFQEFKSHALTWASSVISKDDRSKENAKISEQFLIEHRLTNKLAEHFQELKIDNYKFLMTKMNTIF